MNDFNRMLERKFKALKLNDEEYKKYMTLQDELEQFAKDGLINRLAQAITILEKQNEK